MHYVYSIPWLAWIIWFFGWEAWGFRKGNDHWPTFSQLWKWWEDENNQKGVITWTPFRWFTAIGLPVAAILLEGHWVMEWY